ncbi:MAG TPA: hypothetical protein VK034_07165 [Enhygromyxa sp.]|nr:hypothetical protein [Enhygromyxa sp.]
MSATFVAAGATVSLAPSLVEAAGPNSEEIWFGTGQDSLETDDEGKLTDAGAKSRSTEVDQIPGEEDWELKLHARMGKYAAEGPLYTEFYQTIQGKEYIVYRHEDMDYDGARLYTTVILLEGNIGFNKDREYRVQIVQNNGKKDIVMARGKVKLIDTGREPPKEEGEDEEEDDEGEGEGEEDEEEDDEGGGGEAPPPIEDTPAKKKGCTVVSGGAADLGFSGIAILLLAAASRRRRRD